ncbi:MAG: nodulation protein NodH [Rhodobacteraceae bacterium]|nr:nodulation protein NodH [Paracoccaceae bacterium]
MARFEMFVVLAGMRTGSNLLEEHLNALDGVTCHGEAFNPVFVGGPNRKALLGVDLEARTADPFPLLDRIAGGAGLNGFRFFHDHDPRIYDRVMGDPGCAKIVLNRNPAESYVSRKIAAETGQWKLTDLKHRRAAAIQFDAAEFEAHLEALQAFQADILHRLQVSGQTAFYLDYDDLGDLEVINGLAAFLGVPARLTQAPGGLKPQNPDAMEDKVRNLRAMEVTLARLDRFNLGRTPVFEPRRGPAVPGYRAGATAPLLYAPLRGGPEAAVLRWMATLDKVTVDDLPGGFSQKTLRQWKRTHPGHRTFAVLAHPVVRAWRVFCRQIADGGAPDLRRTLVRAYKLAVPEAGADAAAWRACFLDHLRIVRGTLAGQTSLRPGLEWATQAALVQGLGQFAPPDMLLREDTLGRDLAMLAAAVGRDDAPALPEAAPEGGPVPLPAIHDDTVEAAVRDAYGRDYVAFGFAPWAPEPARLRLV